jgi:acetolactate synthase I/II/III large subunit
MSNLKNRVADSMATTMAAHGVRHAFGIPGNDVLELIRACADHGITFTLAKGESGAAFMAEAVTQVSGKPAACIFALGPGIANGISGVAGASQERAPILVLGGEMAANRREIYNHQAFDHVALMKPVAKYAAELNAQRPGQHVARALDIAMTHPRGPVFLNCPADATRSETKEAEALHQPITVTSGGLNTAQRQSTTATLTAAKHPLALIGRGVLDDARIPAAIKTFLTRWNMPFLATYKAKGIVAEDHPLCLGAIALSPVMDDLSLKIIQRADALILIGFDPIELRDAWLDALPAKTNIVSLETHAQTHRVFATGTQCLGDIDTMLGELTPATARPLGWSSDVIGAHRQAMAEVVRPRTPPARISPAALFHAVSRRITTDLLMTVDVGAHRILANHVLQCKTPGQLLQSNGLGHMGYAIPAAIGAALASKKSVIAMLGDGCALMSLGELALVAETQLPIVTVILVDNDLALIDVKQNKMKMARQGVGFVAPDFEAIAKGFGLAATKVDTIKAFDAALETALASGKPHVIAAHVDPAEYWEQM